MVFPINKPVELHSGDIDYSKVDIRGKVILPLHNHPGSFGAIRKNHRHEGVDLYCEDGDEVLAIEPGTIVGLFVFTGEAAGSPWWEETFSVLVQGTRHVINYGEITPELGLKVGDAISEGQVLGKVKRVLRKDKGRPMSMLHLELYALGTTEPLKEWPLNTKKPANLFSPTNLLVQEFLRKNKAA